MQAMLTSVKQREQDKPCENRGTPVVTVNGRYELLATVPICTLLSAGRWKLVIPPESEMLWLGAGTATAGGCVRLRGSPLAMAAAVAKDWGTRWLPPPMSMLGW